MLPANSWLLFLAFSLVCWLIGVLTGYLTTLVARGRPSTFARDGVLGAFGLWAGFLITSLEPWPYNTVVRYVPGVGTVASSMNRYQHPEWIAWDAAAARE